MWPESSYVNTVNLAKKIFYNSRDIEFFLGDYFLARPVYGMFVCLTIMRRYCVTTTQGKMIKYG